MALEQSVVKIYATRSEYDYLNPWQSPAQSRCSGSGFISEDGRIITNAHVIENTIFLQVKLACDHRRFLARVVAIGHDCDLAVLSVDDPAFFHLAKRLPWARYMPAMRDPVIVCGYPIGGEHLAITEGTIVRFEIGPYVNQGYNLMKCQLDALTSPGSSGGPVLSAQTGEVVGVIHQGAGDQMRITEMVPLNIISHFLSGVNRQDYKGFFSPGIKALPLESAALRRYLKMPVEETGVLVSHVMAGSCAGEVLKKGDVITAIDNHRVYNDGTYQYAPGQHLDISHLFSNAQEGSLLKLNLIRAGEYMTLHLKVNYETAYKELVPPMEYGKPPTYFIYGGLIFQPLTRNYVSSLIEAGCDLYSLSDILYKLQNSERENAESELIVLSGVLSDESNLGYHRCARWIVDAINGVRVNSMRELVRLIEENQDDYLVVSNDRGQELVLDSAVSRKSNKRILQTYQIARDRSPDLKSL